MVRTGATGAGADPCRTHRAGAGCRTEGGPRTGRDGGAVIELRDGSLGMLEGPSSHIGADGRQAIRYFVRADCMGESAMAEAVDKCVHCGFCLASCPTYRVLGEEMDSPRGRIYLMKEALEGGLTVEEISPYVDRCLGCMACVTSCPSGVAYGELGPTHHSIEDVAWTRAIDRLVVIVPADPVDTAQAIRAAYEYEGPVFIRTSRIGVPIVHDVSLARALASIGDTRALPALTKMLAGDARSIPTAVRGIAKLGGSKQVEQLQQLLLRPEREIQIEAVNALARLAFTQTPGAGTGVDAGLVANGGMTLDGLPGGTLVAEVVEAFQFTADGRAERVSGSLQCPAACRGEDGDDPGSGDGAGQNRS